MKDILVVGAGISGLSIAYFAKKNGATVQVLESRSETGGCVQSRREKGYLIESGPNSTMENNDSLRQIIADLQLQDARMEPEALAAKRYVVKKSRLIAMPMSPLAFVFSPLFSIFGKIRLMFEPFIAKGTKEESIAKFVKRRLGPDFLNWAIDPFVSGVYAGDPEKLSAQAAVAKVYALEQKHGSLIKGMLAKMSERKALVNAGPAGKMISFDEGMQVFPKAIAAHLSEDVLCDAGVKSIQQHDGYWSVQSEYGVFEAKKLVLAVPSYVAAKALRKLVPDAAELLEQIDYPHVASVVLAYQASHIEHALDGFGALIPSKEQRKTLGVLFSSSLFANRAPGGQIILTCFIGGDRHADVAQWNDSVVIKRVEADVRDLLGIDGDPVFVSIKRWEKAIPQYKMGHLDKIAKIDEALAELPGLYLQANWRDGIALGDCVANGEALAKRLVV